MAGVAERNAVRLVSIIDDLLDFERLRGAMQGAQIVENPESTTRRGGDEVIVPDLKVCYRTSRQVELEPVGFRPGNQDLPQFSSAKKGKELDDAIAELDVNPLVT